MSEDRVSHSRLLSRREMLKAGTLAAGAAAIANLSGCQTPGTKKAAGPGEKGRAKNMHVSLAAYSMRQALTKGEMDLFEFIDWCAEMDLVGTELTSYYFKENFDKNYLHQLKRRALRNGVVVSGTAVRNNFCLPPGEERDKEIQHVKKWIDYAVEFYAPHIRIFAGSLPEGVDKKIAIIWVADAIKEVLDYAAERGVLIGLENHGGITARAGNYRTNAYEELEMAAPLAVNVQVKVEVFQNDGTKVLADLERVRDILVKAGYKGWVALEYEAEGDPWVEIPMYVKKLKALFEA